MGFEFRLKDSSSARSCFRNGKLFCWGTSSEKFKWPGGMTMSRSRSSWGPKYHRGDLDPAVQGLVDIATLTKGGAIPRLCKFCNECVLDRLRMELVECSLEAELSFWWPYSTPLGPMATSWSCWGERRSCSGRIPRP